MIALAARFYGWSWEDIKEMPYRTLRRFIEYIPELQAREKLIGATISSMPHMTDKDRKRVYDGWLYEARIRPEKRQGLRGADIRAFVGAKPKDETTQGPKKSGRSDKGVRKDDS